MKCEDPQVRGRGGREGGEGEGECLVACDDPRVRGGRCIPCGV